MQSVSSRIWTSVAVFISYDDNNYNCLLYIYAILFLVTEVLQFYFQAFIYYFDHFYQVSDHSHQFLKSFEFIKWFFKA